jgi:lipopolysaccharide biosynthesis glycosyltransferase
VSEQSIEMKEEPIMDIALANDEYYFVGLWNTVLSLLASTPDASRLRINIIDTGISD